MKSQIALNGPDNLTQGQAALSRNSIEKKYATQLAQAGDTEKLRILQKIEAEFEQQKTHKPSRGTLW